MIVTGMFVAQVARVAEGMLDVLGGVQDWIRTDIIGTDQHLPIVLVVLVQREAADDAERSAITVEAFAPSGAQVATAERVHAFPADSENGFVYFTFPIPVAESGRYSFVGTATGSEHSAAIGLRIVELPESG